MSEKKKFIPYLKEQFRKEFPSNLHIFLFAFEVVMNFLFLVGLLFAIALTFPPYLTSIVLNSAIPAWMGTWAVLSITMGMILVVSFPVMAGYPAKIFTKFILEAEKRNE